MKKLKQKRDKLFIKIKANAKKKGLIVYKPPIVPIVPKLIKAEDIKVNLKKINSVFLKNVFAFK
jgi:hypothetical protein